MLPLAFFRHERTKKISVDPLVVVVAAAVVVLVPILSTMASTGFGMRPGIILLREGTDTSQVRSVQASAIGMIIALYAFTIHASSQSHALTCFAVRVFSRLKLLRCHFYFFANQ